MKSIQFLVPAILGFLFPALLFSMPTGEVPQASESPDLILRQAFADQVAGKTADAVESYRQYFETGKESGYARGQYARALIQVGQLEAAIEEARKAGELEPEEPDHAVLLSELLNKKGDREGALKVLESALLHFENETSIEFALGESYLDANQPAKAEVHYLQSLFHLENSGSRGPVYRSMALWRIANIRLKENDPEGAEPYLKRYLKYNPDRIYPRYLLGYYIYFRQGNYLDAETQLRMIKDDAARELTDRNDLSRLYGALARISYLFQEPDRGPLMRQALELNLQDSLVHGLRMEWLGQNRTALQYLVPYARTNPEDIFVRTALVRILESEGGNTENFVSELLNLSELAGKHNINRFGISMANRALSVSASLPQSNLSLAHVHLLLAHHYGALEQNGLSLIHLRKVLEEGEKEGIWALDPAKKTRIQMEIASKLASGKGGEGRALELLARLKDENPENGGIPFTMGLIHLQQKSYEKAVEFFTEALDRTGNRGPVLFYRAVAYHELGKDDLSRADIVPYVESGKASAEAYNFLGYTMAEKGEDLPTSLSYIEKALEMEPLNGSYRDSLGWVYFQKGQTKEALYHIRFASFLMEEKGGADPVVYEHLGSVLEAMERKADALAAYHRGLSLFEKRSRQMDPLNDEDTALREKIRGRVKDLTAAVAQERKEGKE